MWFFNSPEIIFGEEALSWLESFTGKRAFIVTDANMVRLGFVRQVQDRLASAGMEIAVFEEVEPDPTLETVQHCAADMLAFAPDWVIGLGGGSSMDAAKAAWFMYERPDVELEAINPMEYFGLGSKARFVTIPTTAGSGADVTAAAVIKDTRAKRKLEMACRELIPHYTIVDPTLSSCMPPGLTAETGLDALTHAVEGYSSSWANDFSDALCLHAASLIFTYLPRAVGECGSDPEAREKMCNAATLAGLGMGNSHIALAHALGHSMGALCGMPHGRAAGLFLPYTIEFNANATRGRYLAMARILDLPAQDENQAAYALADAIRSLMHRVNLPTSLEASGLSRQEFEANLEDLCERAQFDTAIATSRRIPSYIEINQLFEYAYQGKVVDF